MKVAFICSNTASLPPPKDGGTERIVHELSEGMSRRGHEVLLYARSGSRSSGTVYTYPFDQFGESEIGRFVRHTLPSDIDIISDHTFTSVMTDYSGTAPVVSTRHVPHRTMGAHPVYVSNTMLTRIGGGEGIHIYNGMVIEEYQFREQKQDYLLFMGRIVREKGVTYAIDVAERSNSRLIIAGPKHDPAYFNQLIQPRLQKNSKITYVGPVGGQERQDLLKNARCLLLPIQWEEPFGLVMIEAMACGTPVLALNRGAVKEVLQGFPEFVCENTEEMVRKLAHRHNRYSSAELRSYVERTFHTDIMVERYIQYFHEVMQRTTNAMTATGG